MERYEPEESSESEDLVFELSGDAVAPDPGAPEDPRRVAANVAFMAHSELRQHRQRLLAHHPAADAQEMVSECGGALRAIQKALYAVEPGLCQLENTGRLLPSLLDTSLEVRRHYRKLWNFATVTGDVTPEQVRAALRGAGTRISILAGSEVYSLLREDDRFYIRELQVRILDWLRDGDENLAGVRIWQDFSLFVEILRQVNLREELVRHDRQAIEDAIAACESGQLELSKAKKRLAPILGVDDTLDRAIEASADVATLLSALRRVSTQVSGGSSEVSSHSVAL
ncbi:MAG: hypothetical protein R3B48_14830 [Kofleriaceae bacterium]